MCAPTKWGTIRQPVTWNHLNHDLSDLSTIVNSNCCTLSINEGTIRYGEWQKGKRVKWFDSESEALLTIPESDNMFCKLFVYDLQEISSFYNF